MGSVLTLDRKSHRLLRKSTTLISNRTTQTQTVLEFNQQQGLENTESTTERNMNKLCRNLVDDADSGTTSKKHAEL